MAANKNRAHFRAVHMSGRYDRPDRLLHRALVWIAHLFLGVSVITGTEAGGRPERVFRIDQDRWDHTHLGANHGETWIAWRRRAWSLMAPSTAPILSEMQYRTEAGALFPKFRALRVVLKHRRDGKVFVFYVVHMPLDNTPLRALTWIDVAKGLTALMRHDAEAHPDWEQVMVGDINKNWRDLKDKGACIQHLERPGHVHCTWRGHTPQNGGTHGLRGLIDHAYTTVAVDDTHLIEHTPLLKASSDHWPFTYRLSWPLRPNPHHGEAPE